MRGAARGVRGFGAAVRGCKRVLHLRWFRAVLLWRLRKKMTAAIFRANLDALESLMEHLSGNAAAASARRAHSRRRFFEHGDASRASYAWRSSHSTFSF